MAKLIRANANAYESGEVYLSRIQEEVNAEFTILRTLLSSYWKSTVDGPNYARNLKAVAIALSQIKTSLDSILDDTNWSATRSEYLYQVITNLVFPKDAPNLETDDSDFQSFLLSVIELYFKGSIPSSIEAGVKLLTGGDVKIVSAYEAARRPGSGYDISDEFTFAIDILLTNDSQINTMLTDRNIRILMSMIRPAHTLYKIKNILQDSYIGNYKPPTTGEPYQPNKIVDSGIMDYNDYSYDDFRKFTLGVFGLDPLGFKKAKTIIGEPHTF